MMNMNCEYVREMYPDVLNGTANAETAGAVRAHIAQCAECAAEAALLAQVHAAPIAVPAGLHERVLTALDGTSRARRTISKRHLGLAATVAAALIGGAILFDTGSSEPPSAGLGVVTVEAAMVSGTGSL